jgi:hypothetical protein
MSTVPPLSNSSNATSPAEKQGAHQPLPILLYQAFGGELGPTPWLVVPASIYSVISMLGIALNGSVVYVTVRAKALRGTCSFLLAVVSLLEVCNFCFDNFIDID